MSFYHRFLQIQAYKHDGSFHRLWSHGLVVRDDEDYIVEISPRVRVIESNDHVWHSKDLGIFILSKKDWFNTIATRVENGIRFYVNIASPSIIEKDIIKFVDYDLDLKIYPDGGTKVLDKNEFKMHCDKYQYPLNLQEILKRSLDRVSEMAKNKVEPFNEETINKYIKDYEDFCARRELKDKKELR